MRTSRVSKETAKLVDILSSAPRRQPRRNATSNPFSSYSVAEKRRSDLPQHQSSIIKAEPRDSDDDGNSILSSANTTDIEDLLLPPPSRKRKRGQESFTTVQSPHFAAKRSPSTPARIVKGEANTSQKPTIKEEDEETKTKTKSRRLPARKSKGADGLVKMEPPSNWETIYATVKEMRRKNPTAPVDTMGCAQLYWRSSSPRDRRFQTLIALMLSSQTKDTVTAVAMQRLHTELGPEQEDAASIGLVKKEEGEEEVKAKKNIVWDQSKQEEKSTLNVENILAVSPTRLNELIHSVGFHNNKTKYIKAAAIILRDEYDSDIPSTAEGLMKLPGVGPKMAYLCMSAAWGRDEGIGVDVHVHRITNMWGWHKTKTPEETRAALESWLPRDKWHEINKLLVGLGQTVCLPVARRCGECDLAGSGLCKSEIRSWVDKRKPKKEEVSVKEESKIKIKMEDDS
ncbi:DNA N-glycosylase and apurinic/apyrimidinic (AP) lyase [Onygenales sp. PD_12]|nr:DNA N-glycosylase and apurinic/apyrimidinic (AP) lyase [Onygenales sp. PD_12]